MLLLLICKIFMPLLLDSTCIIILYLEVFLNIILMFYFPLGLMVAYKLLKVVFQTSGTLRMESSSSSNTFLYTFFFSALHGIFLWFSKSLRGKKGCTSSINNLFWKGRRVDASKTVCKHMVLIFICCYVHCMLSAEYRIVGISVIAEYQ